MISYKIQIELMRFEEGRNWAKPSVDSHDGDVSLVMRQCVDFLLAEHSWNDHFSKIYTQGQLLGLMEMGICQPGQRCCYCHKTTSDLNAEEIAESIDNHNEGLSSK